MFSRTRKVAPAIATTRTDMSGVIVEVTFTDGTRAVREHGFWQNAAWNTTVLGMPHYKVLATV